MVARPLFSVVIPVLNGRTSLPWVLRCLEAQTLPHAQFECVVVDDGSRDGTQEFLRSYRSQGLALHFRPHPVNRGRSHARNTGCANAGEDTGSDFLVFLDADMLAEPGCLAAYAEALAADPTLDVISGGRHHLDLGPDVQAHGARLAQLAGATPETLFVEEVAQQFQRLRAAAGLGMYPNPAMGEFEAQLPEACRQYPQSVAAAYALITSNVAVRRSAFAKTGGFDPSLRRFEDSDLGLRLWEMDARFGFAPAARAYHMYYAGQGDRDNTLTERMGLFYRHPYFLVALINIWFAYHNQTEFAPPAPMYASLQSLLAAAPDWPDMDVAGDFYRLYRQPFWAECVCSRELLVEHFHEFSGIDLATVSGLLDRGVARGLVTQRRDGQLFFDYDHASNWLRKCTSYQQYELEHIRYTWLRDWLRDPERPSPSAWQCRGEYTLHVPAAALPASADGLVNLPLPVAHACQTDVQLTACQPPNLLDYADRTQTMLLRIPLLPALNDAGDIVIRYEFTCRLREQRMAPGGAPVAVLPEFLKPTFPPTHLPRAEAILKKIFPAPVADPARIARAIYAWVLDNAQFFQGAFPDHLILELGMGPCVHLVRLFVNLCRLMRIPAREQSGVMLGTMAPLPAGGRRLELAERGYSVMSHTWAEFYAPPYGWTPVEFAASGYGRRVLTAANVADDDLRQRLRDETAFFDDYYFGNLDPFRVYASPQVNRVVTYPLFKARMERAALKVLMWQTRHRVVCDFTPEAGG